MSQRATASLEEHFGDLPDPRVQELIEHRLLDIILITICAVICGADGWEDVAEFGKSKVEWLRTFLELPNGIPSHDTFGRVFARLDPEAFGQRFVGWIRAMEKVTAGQVIAVDGKTVRRSYDHRLGKKAIHRVSAWASSNGLVLGQKKVDDKSHEQRPWSDRDSAVSGVV